MIRRVVDGPVTVLYTRDTAFGTLIVEGGEGDVEASLQKLDKALDQAGSSKSRALMVTCVVSSSKDRDSVQKAVGEWLGTNSPPALVFVDSGSQGVFLQLRLVASR